MNRIVIVLVFVLGWLSSYSQELKCTISINSERATTVNKQLIQTLERSLTEFVNNTQWTKRKVLPEEVIECSMFINLSNVVDNTSFKGSIQVQSSRPVYGSSYSSPVFNYNDGAFDFEYTEFQNLFFNPNSSNTNLVAVIAYYVHMILGFDADSFSLNGGTEYYKIAKGIVDLSQQSGYSGWSASDGNQSRFALVNDILMSANVNYSKNLYQYHIQGLDLMYTNTEVAKKNIVNSLKLLEELYQANSGRFLLRVFFDAKSDEIVGILKDGPSINRDEIKTLLNKISPQNTVKWSKLK